MTQIHISAIIPTFNRASMLKRTLQSLLGQTLPSDEYEIIVVDNNSTDDTNDVVQSFQDNTVGVQVRCILEREQGSSATRNRGAHEAQGELLAFIDDDETASPTWLATYVEAHATLANIGAIGGPCEVVYETERPEWLFKELDYTYAKLDKGEQVRRLDEDVVYEGNLSIRKDLFIEYGGFPTSLGRTGNNYLGYEGGALQSRLRRAGFDIYYLPQAVIWHHIPASRMSRWEVLRRCHGAGRTRVLRKIVTRQQMLTRFGYLKRAAYHIKQWLLDASWWQLIAQGEWFPAAYKASGRIGQIQQEIILASRNWGELVREDLY
jgi:glycosyltransferase involved in cell wall biosynthesis